MKRLVAEATLALSLQVSRWPHGNPQRHPGVIPEVKGGEVPEACRLVRTQSKFGEFSLKLLMTKQMAHRFSFSILSKKKKKNRKPRKDSYVTSKALEALNLENKISNSASLNEYILFL